MSDKLLSALLHRFHERHAAPFGFDSRAEDCDTCKEDAAIAYEVANSPAAFETAAAVVNVEGEKFLSRDDWKEMRAHLIELSQSSHARLTRGTE